MKLFYHSVLSVALALFILAATTSKAEARVRIPVGEIESLKKVADLPDAEDFKIKEGEYADVGILYKTFTIAFVPLWVTKEPVLVAYNEKDDTYINLPDADMDAILKENKLEKNKLIGLGFFTRYGGKLIALALLALIIYGLIPSKKEKKDVLARRV